MSRLPSQHLRSTYLVVTGTGYSVPGGILPSFLIYLNRYSESRCNRGGEGENVDARPQPPQMIPKFGRSTPVGQALYCNFRYVLHTSYLGAS